LAQKDTFISFATLSHLPKEAFLAHRTVSIPTERQCLITVMAVVAEFHRNFLTPVRIGDTHGFWIGAQ